MKILHLSKMDSGGGAADGFVRIHRALLGQGHDSVAYVIKQKRQDVPAMIDARRLLSPVQKLVWGLGRIWAKLSRLHLKPVGVYDFDGEANFPAEPIIRDARAHSGKWDLVVVHWAGAAAGLILGATQIGMAATRDVGHVDLPEDHPGAEGLGDLLATALHQGVVGRRDAGEAAVKVQRHRRGEPRAGIHRADPVELSPQTLLVAMREVGGLDVRAPLLPHLQNRRALGGVDPLMQVPDVEVGIQRA